LNGHLSHHISKFSVNKYGMLFFASGV